VIVLPGRALGVAVVLLAATSAAWGQTPAPAPSEPTPATPTVGGPEPFDPTAPAPIEQGPAVPAPTVIIGPNLFNPPAPQGPVTLTPSFTLSEEFNDNVFLNNRNKKYDFITGFTPGITLTLQQPEYRFNAGYNLTAEIHARETELSGINRQNLYADLFYRLSPRWSLTLTDRFTYDENTNAANAEGIATGRRTSWSNTLSPGVNFQWTPRTALRAFGSWRILRFDDDTEDGDGGAGGSQGSDTYRVGGAVDHIYTPRLTFTGSLTYAYFDIEDEPSASTFVPRVGLTYRITETLTGSLSGGPSILVRDGDTRVTPAVAASLAQRFSWGSVSGAYTRDVGVAGGLGGTTENQSLAAILSVTTLVRGLSLGLTPRWSMSSREDVGGGGRGDEETETVTVGLTARYQLARRFTLIGSYNFFTQEISGSGRGREVDQNRIFVGLQYGYPINFD
jgi:hypothetical protein